MVVRCWLSVGVEHALAPCRCYTFPKAGMAERCRIETGSRSWSPRKMKDGRSDAAMVKIIGLYSEILPVFEMKRRSVSRLRDPTTSFILWGLLMVGLSVWRRKRRSVSLVKVEAWVFLKEQGGAPKL